MTNDILIFILVVIVITALFLAWYLIRSAKIKERLLLIEKGLDAGKSGFNDVRKREFPWLRIGIVLTGIALGAIVVAIIMASPVGQNFVHMPGFSIGVIILFAGISMIVANFIGGSKDQK